MKLHKLEAQISEKNNEEDDLPSRHGRTRVESAYNDCLQFQFRRVEFVSQFPSCHTKRKSTDSTVVLCRSA